MKQLVIVLTAFAIVMAVVALISSLTAGWVNHPKQQPPPQYITEVHGCSLYRVHVLGEEYPVFFTTCKGQTEQTVMHYCGRACFKQEVRVVESVREAGD